MSYGTNEKKDHTEHEKNALYDLFEIQKDTQDFVSNKREAILSPYSNDIIKRINASIYYWNATTAEFSEMIVGLRKNDMSNVHEELVDMLHFILCQFIYIGINDLETPLVDFFGHRVSKDGNKFDQVFISWARMSIDWGLLIDTLPFKCWKSYEVNELVLASTKSQMRLAQYFFYEFCQMCEVLGLDANTLYQGYINKNKINIERQQKGGRYEK